MGFIGCLYYGFLILELLKFYGFVCIIVLCN